MERILALSFPIKFRKLSQRSYPMICFMCGFSFGIMDVIIEFITSPFKDVPNCPTIGCFLSRMFRYYWGMSNMANRTCIGILTISLIFVTFPSIIIGFKEIFGLSALESLGPFYITGLLCSSEFYLIIQITLLIYLLI
ncbi:hypothetical protein DICVIV_03648 [Dictyocaulus viviparus]|uniref:Uncharacterized protein n=1 Tax=Dictyocaulus viviparus TaxID=29172 RepID=A0A0D8Y2H2_DICVI|nr:hypothetical protein DICVIV_03648 [Dictyocaulus viviparus]